MDTYAQTQGDLLAQHMERQADFSLEVRKRSAFLELPHVEISYTFEQKGPYGMDQYTERVYGNNLLDCFNRLVDKVCK